MSDLEMKPLQATLSFWFALTGIAAGLRHKRQLGGFLLLLLSLGWVGGKWERHCAMDLRNYRQVRREDAVTFDTLIHLLLGLLGYRWLTKTRLARIV